MEEPHIISQVINVVKEVCIRIVLVETITN
jgi:hypothetical protein